MDLTEQGREEARTAGELLKEAGFEFDVAYTSVLKRAVRTLWSILDNMDQMWIPVIRDYRLNERHYGALQGLNKTETAAKYGDDQVHIWRRSYVTPRLLYTSDAADDLLRLQSSDRHMLIRPIFSYQHPTQIT